MTMTAANLDAVARRRETPCLIFRPIKNTPLRGVFFVDGREARTRKRTLRKKCPADTFCLQVQRNILMSQGNDNDRSEFRCRCTKA